MSSKKAPPSPHDSPADPEDPSSQHVQPAHPTDPEPPETDDKKTDKIKKSGKKKKKLKKKKKKGDEDGRGKRMIRFSNALTLLKNDKMPVLFKPSEPRDPTVLRSQWGALPPRVPFAQRGPSFSRVLCSETNGKACSTEEECSDVVRDLQYHYIKELGKDDLPYSFLVGGDGEVYEGRGWYHNVPFPNDDLPEYLDDGRLLHICYIGDFGTESGVKPSEDMVVARRSLCEFGVRSGHLEDDHPVITQMIAKV